MATNAFERYHLSRQPFELGRYDVRRVGRDEEWKKLQQLVQAAAVSRSPITAVLLGTYGAGKSFMLWKLAESLEPKASHALAVGPMRLIDPEQKRDFIRSLILRLFQKGIDIDGKLGPLFAGIQRERLKASSNILPFIDLILAIRRPEAAAFARRVLGGNRLLKKEAEAADLAETVYIKTADDALALLQAFQIILKAAGVSVLVMLVDEVEYVEALPRGQKSIVLDSLKHLWDQEVAFFSGHAEAAQLLILLAATPDFWNRTREPLLAEAGRGESGVGITPFFARIRAADVVEMPAELGQREARQLIVNRMSEVREGRRQEDIIPFTSEYVEYVYRLSQGVPRRIIEICGVVIEEAANRKVKEIDMKTAQKILRDLLISYEPVGESH
jgi:hypothetical protein